ncbi:unnamed protein product [Rotaria sp. Silwood2]|nr:unnamed protein product [Rotaria sp. Silwood2]
MSVLPNFNRTSNGTIRPPPPNKNRSNESDFRPGKDNDTRPNMDPFDESPEMLAELPFRLYFLSQNRVPFFYPIFCLMWTLYDNILTAADLFIMAFTSIERYLFVFHHAFYRRYKRLLYRIPIPTCILFTTIWYTVLTFGYPCKNSFGYCNFQCGSLCYLKNVPAFTHFENSMFFMFPLSIIVIGNITLIIRVLIQKSHMKRQRRLGLWRRNLRMITQLTFIAILYMSIYVPSCILLIFGSYVQRGRLQPWATSVRTRYFIHLKYLIVFGCPFMVLAGQREMHRMIKKLLCRAYQHRSTQVYPMTIMNTRC